MLKSNSSLISQILYTSLSLGKDQFSLISFALFVSILIGRIRGHIQLTNREVILTSPNKELSSPYEEYFKANY
ncbi:hypothetical protein KFK09_013138 [Dendrobium nobile]|uniref:Uncharacterized protein n=1 Tax=Dendrobium nobile TaxID=94219 RepID=A0A8T3B6C3_DENNO|nr:hypothetical protein KFK09_013138 [Dendrobium nobile]